MSFTQEKKINLDVCGVCLGCDERCKLGFNYDCANLKRVAYPTIGGERIKEFFCKDGTLKSTETECNCVSAYDVGRFERKLIDTAREIATLCDKYKVR